MALLSAGSGERLSSAIPIVFCLAAYRGLDLDQEESLRAVYKAVGRRLQIIVIDSESDVMRQ